MYVFYVHVFIEYQNRNEWGKYTKISSSNIFVFILIWIIFNCIYDNYVMLFHYFFALVYLCLAALYSSLKSSSISFLSVTRTLAAIFLDICTRHL